MADPDSISLVAELAADRLWALKLWPDLCAEIEKLDAARVLLQAYEVTEQEIRDQVEGTPHEQPPTVTGPAYLMAVFESLRVGKASPPPAERE